MNAGKDKDKAIEQAKANAISSKAPWIVWFSGGVYNTECLSTQNFDYQWLALPNGLVETAEEVSKQEILHIGSGSAVVLDFWVRKKLSSYQMDTVKQDFERDERLLWLQFMPVKNAFATLDQIPCRHVRIACRLNSDDTEQSVFLAFKATLELTLKALWTGR